MQIYYIPFFNFLVLFLFYSLPFVQRSFSYAEQISFVEQNGQLLKFWIRKTPQFLSFQKQLTFFSKLPLTNFFHCAWQFFAFHLYLLMVDTCAAFCNLLFIQFKWCNLACGRNFEFQGCFQIIPPKIS